MLLIWTDPARPEHQHEHAHNFSVLSKLLHRIEDRIRHADEPEYEYLYGGQESYAPAWTLIPAAEALQAAADFLHNGGQRPANITWRHDAA